MNPDPYSFTFEPVFLVLPAAAGLLYARAARRSRPSTARVASFGLGLLLVAAALNSPLETMAVHYLLLIHLLQNVMIADWAPPLLLLGLSPGMRAALARRGGRALAWVTRPRIALPAWLVGWYVIHLAGVYDFALENPWALNIEHALLIALGLLFWWPVLAGGASALVALGYLGAGFVGSAFLGLALTFATTPFYDFYRDAPRLWGLSAVKDQNLGGVLMSGEQAVVFLVAIGYFVLRLLREEEARERALSGDAPPSA
jgi:cytochrome c oxidase assembly factor CtaG